MYIRITPILFLLFFPFLGATQKYYYTAYGAKSGLPSGKVRNVQEDTLGFLWVATDAGLLRFDGKRFSDYSRHLDSEYIKDLLLTNTGQLLLANDTGIFEIDYRIDTAFIRSVVPGSITATDSSLLYPNRVFNDHRGRMWISQPDGRIGLWQEGTLRFFEFPDDHTTGFSNSGFSFAEDSEGVIWAAAGTGQLYRFLAAENRFRRVELPESVNRINTLYLDKDTLWIAGNGIWRAETNSSGKLHQLRFFETQQLEVTSILRPPGRRDFFLGTRQNGLFRAVMSGRELALQEVFGSNDPHRIEQLPFRNINEVYTDSKGNIWLATLQGLGLLQSRFFESVFGLANNNTYFIHPAEEGRLLLSFGGLYEILPSGEAFFGRALPGLEENLVTAIAATRKGIWLGTTNGELLLYEDRHIRRRLDLTRRGSGIFFMQKDRAGNVWFCQAPDEQPISGVSRLGPGGDLKNYTAAEGLENRILVVRESSRGRLYAAGIGPATYLYRYQPEFDAFINLSLPLPFPYSQGFEVHDMAIDGQGIVWLGTTDGLLRYDLERIQRVDLGELTSTEIRAVAALPDGSIWLSTDTEGLLHYRNGNYVVFDEDSGLPTKVTSYRCLATDSRGRLWVGTAEGTVHSRDIVPQPLPTESPTLLSLKAGGKRVEPPKEGQLRLPPLSGLEAVFVSLTFPGAHIDYQHRLLGGVDTSWSDPSGDVFLHYHRMVHGDYRLQVRSRRKGGYLWSPPLTIPFEVRRVWYQTWWANLLFILVGAVLLYYFVYLNVRRLVRRVQQLENTVAMQQREILDKENQLQANRKALEAQAQSLARASEALNHQQEELHVTTDNLQLLHQLVRRLPRPAGWEQVMDLMAAVLEQMRGIAAFEFGYYHNHDIHFRGYEGRSRNFLRRYEEFNEKQNLAVWALVHKTPLLMGEIRREQAKYIEPNDDYRYHSAIYLPFEVPGRQALVLVVYSQFKNAFDQQDLMMLQLFTDFLERTVNEKMGEEETDRQSRSRSEGWKF